MTRIKSKNPETESNDFENQIATIEELLKQSNSGPKTNKDKNQNDFFKATVTLIKNMCQQINDFKNQNEIKDEKIDELTNEVYSLKNQVIDLEYENCKNIIRIDGHELHEEAKDGKETEDQSLENFEQMLENIDCGYMRTDANGGDIKVADCWRIPNQNNKSKPPTLIAKFKSSSDKFRFLSSLKDIQHFREYENIEVNQQFPKSLRNRLNILKKKAFDERRKKANTKTSIRYISNDLKLYKKIDTGPWNIVSV